MQACIDDIFEPLIINILLHKSYHKYILWGRQNYYIVILFSSCKTNCRRRVAQFGRALRSGRRGRKFESCHADLFIDTWLDSHYLFYFGTRA